MEPLEKRLHHYLSRAGYEPQDRSGIARGMGVDSSERAELRALLSRWEAEKKLLRLRGAKLTLAQVAHASYTGIIRVLGRGKKIFVPHAEGQQALATVALRVDPVEVPIAPGRSMGAMDGDVVRARVLRSMPPAYHRRRKALRPDSESGLPLVAQVEEVMERRRECWVGVLQMQGRQGIVRGDGRSAPGRIYLSAAPPPEAVSGMLVTVQPESGMNALGEARGRVLETLGWPEDAGVDMAALIRRYGLREAFDAAVLEETLQLPEAPLPAEKAGREDWTRRCVVTIDPPTARDYDDAICVQRLPGGGWELAVHIADVSHYVRPGSALDAEACRRGNSTYLPDRVLPMLPPRLCDDLCSLLQGEERLTMLCHMRFSAAGEVEDARLARAVICSRRRLDYPAVLKLLETGASTGDAEVDEMLREGSQLAQLLRRRRFAAGALNLDMPELRAVLDDQGRTAGFEQEESDASHQLIEEFMLAANEQVARLLHTRSVPTLYRVHEEPAADKWSDLAHTLREYGITASMHMSRKELLKVMESIIGHPEERRLKVALLRSMMRARYAPHALGHFGLALENYCHFTSPIRRYADLVVHRGVVSLLEKKREHTLSGGQLTHLADHLSDTERQSAAAEAEAMKLKALQYMEAQCSEEHPAPWQAIVCGVWAHGIAVELDALPLRGYIPASHLPRRAGWRYIGRRWLSADGRRLEEGARLSVAPAAVDWESQSVDFRPVEAE